MSVRTSTLAWDANVQSWMKLVLLGMAEVTSDSGELCDLMGASVHHLAQRTGFSEDALQDLIIRLLDGGEPVHEWSGRSFRFERLVERAEEEYPA